MTDPKDDSEMGVVSANAIAVMWTVACTCLFMYSLVTWKEEVIGVGGLEMETDFSEFILRVSTLYTLALWTLGLLVFATAIRLCKRKSPV